VNLTSYILEINKIECLVDFRETTSSKEIQKLIALTENRPRLSITRAARRKKKEKIKEIKIIN